MSWRHMTEWRHSSVILDLGPRWRYISPLHAPENDTAQYSLDKGAGWAPGPVWTQWSREKSLAPDGSRTPKAQSVGRRYTDWSIQKLHFNMCSLCACAPLLILTGYSVPKAWCYGTSTLRRQCQLGPTCSHDDPWAKCGPGRYAATSQYASFLVMGWMLM
jgi:hypothetical protein